MTVHESTPAADPDISPAVSPDASFERARRLTEPALRAALDRLEPRLRHACGYHFGFWDAEGMPRNGGGKGVRPALALLSAQAAGAPAERGVPAAAACELVHNFSLLHDDIIDGDTERRHVTTVWARFGTSTAILAGDALLALANEVLSESGSPAVPWAVRCLGATTRRLTAGQVADVAFETTPEVSLDECLRMAADKTAAMLACAASLGAVVVDAPAELSLGLADYGTHLGVAFQLTDDLLGIWGSPETTGKPVWSDLRARKKTVPVVAALTSDSSAGEQLRALYRQERPLDEDQLATAAALVDAAGGRAWTVQRSRRESALALAALDGLDLPPAVRAELAALVELLSRREH